MHQLRVHTAGVSLYPVISISMITDTITYHKYVRGQHFIGNKIIQFETNGFHKKKNKETGVLAHQLNNDIVALHIYETLYGNIPILLDIHIVQQN